MQTSTKDSILSAVCGMAFAALILFVMVFLARLISGAAPTTISPELPQSQRVGETPSRYINRWHDDEKNVTCWQIRESISCLHD